MGIVSRGNVLSAKAEVGRELGIRKNSYPKLVMSGKMKEVDSQYYLGRLTQAFVILEILLRDGEVALDAKGD